MTDLEALLYASIKCVRLQRLVDAQRAEIELLRAQLRPLELGRDEDDADVSCLLRRQAS